LAGVGGIVMHADRRRGEIKRLRQTEMAAVDDPTTRNVLLAQTKGLRVPTRGAPLDPGRSKMGKPGMRGGFKKRGR